MVQDKVRDSLALPAVAVGMLAVSAAIHIRPAEAPAIAVDCWHFGFWISSLDHTSVVASAVLVSAQPVFVVIRAYLLFG